MKSVAFPDDVHQVEIVKVGRSLVVSPAGHRWDNLFLQGRRASEDFMSGRDQPPVQGARADLMLQYMLDTNICIYVIKNYPAELRERFNQHADQMCISAMTLSELSFGRRRNPADVPKIFTRSESNSSRC